jgi:predicted DNA-binding transcriptional regulator YafY
MPANKYALLRYRIIDRCISGGGFPTKEDLRYACEEALYGSDGENISDSTIEKDIWAMRNESELGYYAPIKYHRDHRGYYYEEEGYSINEVQLGDEDLEAIKFAANTLIQFRDLPIFQQFDQAISKIADRLAVAPDLDTSGVERFMQFESTPAAGGSHHLATLLDAAKNCNPVKFSYKKFSSDTESEYELHPYLLKEYRNRWYLMGLDVAKQAIRTFGLDRVQKIEVNTKDIFSQGDFDSESYFKHAVGITVIDNSPPVKVVLKANSVLGSYLISQPLHPSQQVEQHGDHVIISYEIIITFEFIQWIMGLITEIEVLEPASLKEKIVEKIRNVSTT